MPVVLVESISTVPVPYYIAKSCNWWGWKCHYTKAWKLWNHGDSMATLTEGASDEQREKFEHTAVRAQVMIV